VIPPAGVAYLSVQPEKSGLVVSSIVRSMSALLKTLDELKLTPAHVVQLKVFVAPASSAQEVLGELKKLFPGQLTPPVIFVEWLASVPVEIELVAHLPIADGPAETVEFFNPPDVTSSTAFSRVALVRTDRQVYISGLSSRVPGTGEVQARDVFEQLKTILAKTNGDLRYLAKATYYVSDDDASKGLTKVRPEFLDGQRPPAASKVTVHGVGQSQRTLTVDMIAVGSGK